MSEERPCHGLVKPRNNAQGFLLGTIVRYIAHFLVAQPKHNRLFDSHLTYKLNTPVPRTEPAASLNLAPAASHKSSYVDRQQTLNVVLKSVARMLCMELCYIVSKHKLELTFMCWGSVVRMSSSEIHSQSKFLDLVRHRSSWGRSKGWTWNIWNGNCAKIFVLGP